MDAVHIKNSVLAVLAAVGTFVAHALGGWDAAMQVLVALLAADYLTGIYIRTAIIIFFIGNEGLSLLENLGLMGVPFPAFLKRALEALREQGDNGEDGGAA